jgi:hypothetical protein
MAPSKQNFVPGLSFSVKGCFGGSTLRSNPKQARPFSKKNRIHVVLRLGHSESRGFATMTRAFQKSALRLVRVQAEKFSVSKLEVYVYRQTLQIKGQWTRHEKFSNFLRSVTGLLARQFLKAERGQPSREMCFLYRPFSCLLEKIPFTQRTRLSHLLSQIEEGGLIFLAQGSLG